MKPKQQKREEALKRLYNIYQKYSDGEYTPSNKDLEILWPRPFKFRDILLAEKISQTENEIVALEQKLKKL